MVVIVLTFQEIWYYRMRLMSPPLLRCPLDALRIDELQVVLFPDLRLGFIDVGLEQKHAV